MKYLNTTVGLVCALASGACADASGENMESGQLSQPLSSHDFDVEFEDCTEYVGIGLVPEANARPLVPTEYDLVEIGTDVILVARVVECGGVGVDGKKSKPAKLSQIGITIQGGDTTADINNYTLWYATDLGVLHGKLTAAGVENDKTRVVFDFTPDGAGGGAIDIALSPQQVPDHQATGTGIVPTSAPVPFVATWWAEGNHGSVRMRTELPAIQFSGANVTLTTSAGSELADLIGGTSLTFPLLDSYNAFSSATMVVTRE